MGHLKNQIFSVSLCLSLFLTGGGCSRHGQGKAAGNSQSHFRDESQFIVETVATDLAEEIYYAKFHKLPPAKEFSVAAVETPESQPDAPAYEIQITLDGNHRNLKASLRVNGPIWGAATYSNLTAVLAQSVGWRPAGGDTAQTTELLRKLTDALATTIEKQNQQLSQALADDFGNAALHEQAAVLLGAFALREHSGNFYEIRSPLCRLTAHLAMAGFLSGNSPGINGQMASVMLDTLMNNQQTALDELRDIKSKDAAVMSWANALRAINTCDYRPLNQLEGLSPVECMAWFFALDRAANPDVAWGKLSDAQKHVVDFVRVANEGNYSVEMGHELLDAALPLEFKEMAAVHQLSRGQKLKNENLATELNQMPERCVSGPDNDKPEVRVVGWGLWAGFFQRQLCMAVEENFRLMQHLWGVPDDAKAFAKRCDQEFSGLRLYPFVRRLNSTDVASYRQAVDDGFKVTAETPQLVPAECWNFLCYEFSPGECYQPVPNRLYEWHKHNPPPGTAYNPFPRVDQGRITGHENSRDMLDKMRALAPYDRDIAYYLYETRYQKHPTYEQARELFLAVLPYSDYALGYVAETVKDQPAKYEALIAQAAEINPSRFFSLADFCIEQKEDGRAASFIEKGNALDPDAVRASYYASWLIKYYLKNGNTNAARKEAEFAGDVYSATGLRAKAEFLEAIGDYSGAFKWFSNDEERYDDSSPVIAFCLRHRTQFAGELRERLGKLFPGGIQNVKLADFRSAPTDGVAFISESGLLQAAGLRAADVIVAAYGIRVHNTEQYNYARNTTDLPELDLIVWKPAQQRYDEVKASPPQHLFGVELRDYPTK